MRGCRRVCIALSLLLLTGSTFMQGGPAGTLGRDPGGTAIAILASGFEYTKPDVSAVLARDGEGEAIASDQVDGDHRPFEYGGDGTRAVLAATALGGVRVVMIGTNMTDGMSVFRALQFATRTPARIALIPLTSETRSHLRFLSKPSKTFGNVLIVTSAPAITEEEQVNSDGGPNFILLDSKDDELIAAKAIARALGCGQAPLAGSNGAELKTAFLARLQAQPPATCEPESARKPN